MHGRTSRRGDLRLGTQKPTRVVRVIVTTTVSSTLLSLLSLPQLHTLPLLYSASYYNPYTVANQQCQTIERKENGPSQSYQKIQ
jgi:hypothetical protein